jgi:hypothetical protein
MKIRQLLLFAAAGLLAGAVITIGMGFIFFPTLMGKIDFSGSGADLLILAFVGLPTSIAALVGGLVGGRLINEGGRGGQIVMAIIVGIMLALPVSCIGFWITAW